MLGRALLPWAFLLLLLGPSAWRLLTFCCDSGLYVATLQEPIGGNVVSSIKSCPSTQVRSPHTLRVWVMESGPLLLLLSGALALTQTWAGEWVVGREPPLGGPERGDPAGAQDPGTRVARLQTPGPGP